MNEALASFSYFLDVDNFADDCGWSWEVVHGSAGWRLSVFGYVCLRVGSRSCAWTCLVVRGRTISCVYALFCEWSCLLARVRACYVEPVYVCS